jgi:cytoskeleton protein RodZ
MIRAAREAQGIDLGAFAAMLKIPMRKLESLEEDRHEELPGATFERALAQTACRALHIDARPVLALLPQGGNTLERVTGGLNTPFRERQGPRVDLGEATTLLRPMVLLPALLVLAALALFFLPASVWHRLGRQAEAVVEVPVPASSPDVSASAPAPSAEPASGMSATTIELGPNAASNSITVPAAAAPAVVPTPVPAPVPAPGASAAMPVSLQSPAVAPSRTAVAAAVMGVPVTVTARESSWVEVSDAQGRTLISRVVVSGETVALDGAMPLKVRIGNARATTLTLRGENVDLAPWVQNNVARLQLK